MTQASTHINKPIERNICVGLLLIPFAVHVLSWIVSPGWLLGFFTNEPIGGVLVAICVIWDLLGVYCLFKCNIQSSIARLLCIAIFGGPSSLQN